MPKDSAKVLPWALSEVGPDTGLEYQQFAQKEPGLGVGKEKVAKKSMSIQLVTL